jgi:thioesterase domain-containing protein
VLYTSGSTGHPKGVEVTHRCVVNFLLSMQEHPGLGADDGLLAVTTLSFDIAVLELFLPLTVGARVILLSREAAADGARLLAELSRPDVTAMQATPATWRLLLESGWRPGKPLKVLCGGEALPRSLADGLLQRAGSVWNMYGPTETTVWSALHWLQPGSTPVPIGEPIANTQIYLLDSRLRPVPPGCTGELYIGGVGVARGYHGRPALTAERFVPDPFGTPGGRLYRTGDLARSLPDGTLECLGRVDHQVKVRGFRIELGEIEAALGTHPGVRQAVAVARADGAGDKRLAAYVVAADVCPTASDLRAHLKEHLPEYMVPADFVFLPAIPLTPNGKVDRKALPSPQAGTTASGYVPPRTPLEIQMAFLWEEVLGRRPVGITDNFFEIGGHSLLAARLFARIEAVLGRALPLRALFEAPTVEGLAALFLRAQGEYSWPTVVPVRPGGSGVPLFCVTRPAVNPLGYVFLAQQLPPEQSVYVLQSARYRREDVEPYRDEEFVALAAEYVAEMRAVQPVGPYLLTGYCEGALIAFHMARQLRAAGQDVGLLAMLDAWPVENTRSYWWSQVWVAQRGLARFWRLGRAEKVQRLRKWTRRALGPLGRLAGRRPGPVPNGAKEAYAQRYFTRTDAAPAVFDGKITVFRVRKQPYWRIRDDQLGWGKWAQGGVEVHEVPGEHLTLLREPHVQVLAAKLQDCLARAVRR